MPRIQLLSAWAIALIVSAACAATLSAQGAATGPHVEKVVVPFLTKYCVACHGPEKAKADLKLHGFKDEKSLLQARKVWKNILEQVHAGEMPPTGKPRPSATELEAFFQAVNAVYAAADRSAQRDPGHVTIRRLNRTEYNNTIRDLVGVDFAPAEDFPSDDVGYGFDNIGDVLTLSPLLMERYLSAAEAIVQRAIIVGDPPKPAERPRISTFLEPKLRNANEKPQFRSVVKEDDYLRTTYVLQTEGDYRARVRAYGRHDKEPVKFALLINGKQEKTFEVTVTEPSKAAFFEVALPLKPGRVKVEVKLLNARPDPEVKEPAKQKHVLWVQQIQLVGPLDTRPLSHRQIMAHKPGAEPREAAREILTRFASRAYRRPATAAEVERLLQFVDRSLKNKERLEVGFQQALQAVLCSPKFLFRLELDDRPVREEPYPIDDYQLAARLSYFLWSSMPDDELFDLAAKKQLHQNLDAQVRRMLKDGRARALVENFALQWLQLRNLKTFAPDRKLFAEFDEPLRAAMLKETELFIDSIIKEDRSILDLIDGHYTFLNERLARHYGIADTLGNLRDQRASAKAGTPIKGEAFVRVDLPAGQRGGILTQASILTVTSNPTRTSPVKRGRWVLEQIFGTPPPPPPPDVPELVEKGELKGTLRQRMEQHRKNVSCANCHARMDPIGFGFENYDAIGRYRTRDGELPIDPAGELPGGQSFKGPNELKAILKGKKELFSRCLTEKLLTYSIGRGVEYYDRAALDAIAAALARDDYRFSTLLLEIVKSDPFRYRRGKEPS